MEEGEEQEEERSNGGREGLEKRGGPEEAVKQKGEQWEAEGKELEG